MPVQGLATYSFRSYGRISDFFKRHLSIPSDSLHAIEGILEAFDSDRFEAMRAKHSYGVPIYYKFGDSTGDRILVGSSLTWWTKKAATEVGTDGGRHASNTGLPSWTWASSKSTRPHATDELIFICDPWELASHLEIEYGIQHESGKAVGFFEFTTVLHSQKYLEYTP